MPNELTIELLKEVRELRQAMDTRFDQAGAAQTASTAKLDAHITNLEAHPVPVKPEAPWWKQPANVLLAVTLALTFFQTWRLNPAGVLSIFQRVDVSAHQEPNIRQNEEHRR